MNIAKRGTYTKIEDFIKDSVANTNKPYRFDVKQAPSMIVKAMIDGENITIIGDYDCDGICASAISMMGFKRLRDLFAKYKNEESRKAMAPQVKQRLLDLVSAAYECSEVDAHAILQGNQATATSVKVRIPYRYTEGYGMKATMVDEINSGLVFTVDNGIAAIDAIQKARDKGLTTIVTDHHSLAVSKKLDVINGELVNINTYTLPNAHCVINPHMEETMGEAGHYDFYDYCGAGVALKIVESLLGPNDMVMDKLYAFAAIATVADVMPMVHDNRNIFARGIKAMADNHITKGLKALLDVSKIDMRNLDKALPVHALLTSDTMGFTLGPKINAPGRVGTTNPASKGGNRGAERSLQCLLCEDESLAKVLAQELHDANDNRKEISKAMQMQCEIVIAQNKMQDDCPLVVHLPDCPAGIIGLVAGYLCETYKVPSIVFNGHGDACKGSARSPENANMKALLDETQHLIVQYGGHPGAAGLTVEERNINALRDALKTICTEQGITANAHEAIEYDLEIDAHDIKRNTDVLVKTLAPFGEQNPEPIFLIRNFPISNINVLGGKHLKLSAACFSAIGFGLAEHDNIVHHVESNSTCDIIGTLSYNCFRGEGKLQVSMQHFVVGNEILIPDEPHLAEEEIKR
jgi:single-stranded-DNA-specific exonuclease